MNPRSFARRLAAFAMLLFTILPAFGRDVLIYDYHLKPPFIVDVDRRTGLDFDIAAYLSARTGYRFRLEYLPRNRLNRMIELNTLDGLMIGVNPAWFGDSKQTRFLWTQPYMQDDDLVISLHQGPIDYSGPASLKGLRVGFPEGYYYTGISELADSGELMRDNAPTEEQNLLKLLAKHIDVTIVSRSTYDYLLRQHQDWANRFFVADQPEEHYDRRLLVPRQLADVHRKLQAVLDKLPRDPAWKTLVERYR